MVAVSANWRDYAECQYTDPEIFFPDKGHPAAPAKRICMQCTVRLACLAWAVEHPERLDGIWGGLTRHERSVIRRQTEVAA